jgi:hypothetical protein
MVNATGPTPPAAASRHAADERGKKRGEIVFDVADIAGEADHVAKGKGRDRRSIRSSNTERKHPE